MKNPLLIVLLGLLWVIGQIAASLFRQLIKDGTFSFLKKGFRGAMSGISYYIGAEYMADDQWIVGASFLALGTGFIYWALLRPDKPLWCSFCGKHQNQVKQLIPVPGVFICDDCIDRVHTVLATHKTASTPISTIEYVSDDNREVRCSLCRKHRYQVNAMAAAVRFDTSVKRGAGLAGRDTRICNRCLAGCDYLLSLWLEREHERTGATHGPRSKEVMNNAVF